MHFTCFFYTSCILRKIWLCWYRVPSINKIRETLFLYIVVLHVIITITVVDFWSKTQIESTTSLHRRRYDVKIKCKQWQLPWKMMFNLFFILFMLMSSLLSYKLEYPLYTTSRDKWSWTLALSWILYTSSDKYWWKTCAPNRAAIFQSTPN